jgi:hypothetical protein
MSSPASRQRQRHRRRAQERLWTAQAALTDREADLVAYDRVIADIEHRYRDSRIAHLDGAQAVTVVTTLRDATKSECDKLAANITVLEIARKRLEPAGVTP